MSIRLFSPPDCHAIDSRDTQKNILYNEDGFGGQKTVRTPLARGACLQNPGRRGPQGDTVRSRPVAGKAQGSAELSSVTKKGRLTDAGTPGHPPCAGRSGAAVGYWPTGVG